jgi:KDEL-tailed cysteine endopeptidase
MFGEHYGLWGCGGGWMAPHWRFMRDHGVMTNEDYPYKAKDQPCAHDYDKTIGKTTTWGVAGRTDDVATMKAKIETQPGAVAINASARNFRFYRSGTLKGCCEEGDTNCDEEKLSINHAVTVVGYTIGGEKETVEKCSMNRWWIECSEEESDNNDNKDADGDANYWKI